MAVGCLTSPVSVSRLTPCRAGRLLPVVVGPPGTVVADPPGVVDPEPGGVVVVVAPATWWLSARTPAPSPSPRRKKKAITKIGDERYNEGAEPGLGCRCGLAMASGHEGGSLGSRARLDPVEAFSPRKISDTDESMKIAWSVSARIGAIESTWSLSSSSTSGATGSVLVTMTSSTGAFFRRSSAGSEKTPWVAAIRTLSAP